MFIKFVKNEKDPKMMIQMFFEGASVLLCLTSNPQI